MPELVSLKLIIEPDKGETIITSSFSDEEWETMSLFLDEWEAISKTRLVRDGDGWGNGTLGWHIEKGLYCKAELPDRARLTEFLHSFRPVYLEEERTNFNKVRAILKRRMDNQPLRAILDKCQNLYTGKVFQSQIGVLVQRQLPTQKQGQVKLEVKEVIVNSDEVLKQWLYGREYHRDELRKAFLKHLHSTIPEEFAMVIYLGLLRDKMLAVCNVANFIKLMRGLSPGGMHGNQWSLYML